MHFMTLTNQNVIFCSNNTRWRRADLIAQAATQMQMNAKHIPLLHSLFSGVALSEITLSRHRRSLAR